MANAYASDGRVDHGLTKARKNITSVSTIYGSDVVWNISAVAAAYDVTVGEYDATMYNQYKTIDGQPCVIIKCAADCSVQNCSILSSDGAAGTTTHYTFAADYSATPRYVVLRLSATMGADGKYLWEVA